MFTLRNSVESVPGKINVFIKSYTISPKHNNWFQYSAPFTEFKKLTYKMTQPISVSSEYLRFTIYIFFLIYEASECCV